MRKRIVDHGTEPATETGYLCAFCGYSGNRVDVEGCEQCTYPLDPVFYEEVYQFADLFRKEG